MEMPISDEDLTIKSGSIGQPHQRAYRYVTRPPVNLINALGIMAGRRRLATRATSASRRVCTRSTCPVG